MASRSQSKRPPERETDSMEAIKPLIVLVLFGTILYGAYSVVQKGPSPEASRHANASAAPPFHAPQVEIPQPESVGGPGPAPESGLAPPAFAGPAPAAASDPLAIPGGQPPGLSTEPPGMPPPAVAAAIESPVPPPAVTEPAVPPVSGEVSSGDAAITAAAVGPAAAGGTAAALATHPAAPGTPADVGINDAPPTYLAAESAAPPVQEDVAVPSGAGEDRPQRLATLSPAAIPPASLPPEMPPPAATMPSSAAFATAWSDAHDKLTAGRYAEALTALSIWYDDPSLGLEESHRLEDLLGQLAGTVIYSQQDLLLPPHVVAPGETLPAIAVQLGVSWQLLAKINGVTDPMQLVPGEHLKLIRGPFDAVVSISRRRLSLQLGGAYAGSFPVVVGREFLPRVGSSLSVTAVHRDAASSPASGRRLIVLDAGVVIEGADDPALVADDAAPASLVVSNRDLDELLDILGPGSSVLLRQ
jgi:LysM repeat protein